MLLPLAAGRQRRLLPGEGEGPHHPLVRAQQRAPGEWQRVPGVHGARITERGQVARTVTYPTSASALLNALPSPEWLSFRPPASGTLHHLLIRCAVRCWLTG